MGEHATREEEIDDVLRGDVLVGLSTASCARRSACETAGVAVELGADALRDALARLERRDPRLAADAADAVESLSWSEPEDPVRFGLHDLQLFLWYVLPCKWIAPEEELLAVARALGELLEAAGAPERYVALCRSAETERLIRSGGDGFAELLEESGLEPPDVPPLEWSDLMTPEEADFRADASRYLEDAVERGAFEPGAPGWRGRQQAVLETFLTSRDESGETPLARIRLARVEAWLGPPGLTDELGGERRSRLEPLVPLLEQEPDAEAAASALDPLLWLLGLCSEGAQLTQTMALARAIVREGVERYPVWWHEAFIGPPQRELDVRPLELLHAFALELKLVRRHRRTLRLSRLGRELRSQPQALLRLVAEELAAAGGFGIDVGLAFLLTGSGRPTDTVEAPAWIALGVDSLLTPFAGMSGWIWTGAGLTEGGRTLALAILRARATGPRHVLF